PEARDSKCTKHHFSYRARPKCLDVSDLFHRMTDGDIACSAAQYNDRNEKGHSHLPRLLVVFGAVSPTKATPPQMNNTPTHRIADTASPSKMYPRSATKGYPMAEAGWT